MNLRLKEFSLEIEESFKSLMQSGRPDVYDGNEKVITSDLYVDLFENKYMLRQVLDSNHMILKGRRGTGKSTIFVKAEDYILKNKKKFLPIYINLQSCYEEIKKYNELTQLITYKNFLNEIFQSIRRRIKSLEMDNVEMDNLFAKIKNGEYIDADFKREYEMGENKADRGIHKELRIYSINTILNSMKDILKRNEISKVYLFLDDFSELSEDKQKVIVDSLISPIIASYNDFFTIKIAAYPGRIYMGNSDATKVTSVSLDFYDAFGRDKNYAGIEKASIDYIKRTLEQRLKVYTNNKIGIKDIFDLSKEKENGYLKLLFECTAAIPRILGFILNYCYLGSINSGKTITIDNIEKAASKYYEENIYADFINDIRFKQSFYDDKNLLDQVTQNNLIGEITKYLYNVKKNIIKNYKHNKLENDLFKYTIENCKKKNKFWIPTSYFYVNKEYENLLKTLELGFLINKVSEGSIRGAGGKVSYYSLNYGLCMSKKIDFGRPAGRRRYDYWRQPEFDLTNFIPKVLSNIEIIQCSKCGKVYNEVEYDIYLKNKNCFQCGYPNTVTKKNKFEIKLKDKIDEWKSKSLPDIHIEILRVLYNNKDKKMSASEIGTLIDKHHLTVTNASRRLKKEGYIDFVENGKRYYYITNKSIAQFFSQSIENAL